MDENTDEREVKILNNIIMQWNLLLRSISMMMMRCLNIHRSVCKSSSPFCFPTRDSCWSAIQMAFINHVKNIKSMQFRVTDKHVCSVSICITIIGSKLVSPNLDRARQRILGGNFVLLVFFPVLFLPLSDTVFSSKRVTDDMQITLCKGKCPWDKNIWKRNNRWLHDFRSSLRLHEKLYCVPF